MLDPAAPLSLVFQALADPTRRLIVERLCRGPATVSELARPSEVAGAIAALNDRLARQAEIPGAVAAAVHELASGIAFQTATARWVARRLGQRGRDGIADDFVRLQRLGTRRRASGREGEQRHRHCEERSDEAIQGPFALLWIASSPLRGSSQ